MKEILSFIILLLIVNEIVALKSAKQCNPLTLRCRCSNIHKPVCGEKGVTHVNACVASCFGDKIKHEGPCSNQCQTSNQSCKYVQFGLAGGKRLRCCNESKICFGATCTIQNTSCKWKGPVIKVKRQGHCFWRKKSSSKYQRICCRWSKVCKGSCKKGTRSCYHTLKRCKWTGRVITTKNNKSCSYIHTEHGKRKRCCKYTRKCINFDRLTCKSKRKPKCWAKRTCKFVGPFIKKKCKRTCQNTPVGKYGRKKKCCIKCRTCTSFKYTETPKKRVDVCETSRHHCFWKGPLVIIRKHGRCAIRAYGRNKNRKRCCNWSVRCIGKHCKTVHRRCRWVGCVISFQKKRSCRLKMKNNHEKQKYCCKWRRRCCGAKCKNYNIKCKFIGKVIVTKHHWKCRNIKRGKGIQKRCCQIKKVCVGKKCSFKRVKCVFRGCLKIKQRIFKCRVKTLTKDTKCKYCCSKIKKCDCGVCRYINTKCKCVKKYVQIPYTKCKRIKKRKGQYQKQCCKYKKICVNKRCRVLKAKKCKWVGFITYFYKKYKCTFRSVRKNKRRHAKKPSKKPSKKILKKKGVVLTKKLIKKQRKDRKLRRFASKKLMKRIHKRITKKLFVSKRSKHAKRKYCCRWFRKCVGLKCINSKKRCRYVGGKIEQKVIYKCSIKRFGKNSLRKRCCSIKRKCKGTRCKVLQKRCKWSGVSTKFQKWKKTRWVKVKKFCKRKQTCYYRRFCKGVKCSRTIKKCYISGSVICKYRRFKKTWVRTRKGCHIRRACAFSTICINDACRSTKPKCSRIGKEVCQKSNILCRLARFGKGKCFKRRCCNVITKCAGKKCKRQFKNCKWFGKERCRSFTYKCKLQKYKNNKLKMQCCKKEHICIGKKCQHRIKWCKWKGQSHEYKYKKICQMVTIKQHRYLVVKRKRCSLYRKKCIAKRGCKVIKTKTYWEGKKIIIRKFRNCSVKSFSKKYDRTHCCRFTRICQDKKCKNIFRGCFWTGKKIYKQESFTRWKVICKDVPFGKHKNIRLNCCKVKQRCISDGPVYKCENIKRSKCWWRGAIRGDVWIQDQNGEWQEVNAVGSFRYLDDIQSGVKIDTQFTQVGKGSITSSIVISGRNNVIKTSNGKVLLNGKEISKNNQNLFIRFIGNKVKFTSKGKGNKTIIRGLAAQRFGFTYDPTTKSYMLTVISNDNSKGLFTDPLNPAKYQLSEKDSKFDSYIKFQMIRSDEGTPEQRQKAMACCHLLRSEEKLHECISDFVKTGKCLIHSFKNVKPDHVMKKK